MTNKELHRIGAEPQKNEVKENPCHLTGDLYDPAIRSLRGNWLYGNFKLLEKRELEIDERLYCQAQVRIEMGNPAKWRYEVDALQQAIAAGEKLPAIAVRRISGRGGYWHILDGNHRVVALYQSGVKTTPAIIVKVNE